MINSRFDRFGLYVLFLAASVATSTAQATVKGVGGVIPAAKVAGFLTSFAAVIPSQGTATVTKDATWVAITAYNPTTGKAVALAGVGGSGSYRATVSGASGPCFSMGGAMMNASLDAGAGSVTYYQLNAAGDPIPGDANGANALFVKLFGPGSLNSGESLSKVKISPNGANGAFYWTTSAPVTYTTLAGSKRTTTVTVIKAIALVNGQLAAVYALGTGALWGKYSK